MVSPGAETHLGRKFELLGIIFLYPKYFDSTDPRPVYFIGFLHRILGMVGPENKTITLIKVNGHLAVFGPFYHGWSTNKKIAD